MSALRERAVSVRWLAETVHRQGDLYPYRGSDPFRAMTRAEEGMAAQKRAQRDRPADYQVEQAVRHPICVGDTRFDVRGRIDGLLICEQSALVEEFKTTRTDPQTAHAHDGSVHWAQVQLYAALLSRDYPQVRSWRLRLLYCHPDTDDVCTWERISARAELERFLVDTLERVRPPRQQHHERTRDAWLAARRFPYDRYRPHQRAIARRCFKSLRGGESLLIESPTGSGKTMAVIFPALKNLAINGRGKLLFLTSRGTGAEAAQGALARVDPGKRYLRHLTIKAKEKACIVEGMPCSAQQCRYARGYYDKRGAALDTLLERHAIDAGHIEEVARRHEVCPFELSLDAAVWADVVICDYNYVFDPVVRLQRFMADAEIDLLVDEAHQLSGRAAEMLSVSIERREFKSALHDSVGNGIARRLKSIDRALTALRRQHGKNVETVIGQPLSLTRAIGRLLEEVQVAEVDLSRLPGLQAAVFRGSRWMRSEAWRAGEAFEYLLDTRGRGISVRSQCLDPSGHLRESFAGYGANIRFSGTLSPLELYNRLHGQDDAACERAASAFDERQLAVLLVGDVDTYFRGRERSIGHLADAVHAVYAAHPGRYLVAFPSYAYLDRFAVAARARFPTAPLHCQTPDMTEARRDAFLRALQDGTEPFLAAVVLGGIFAESVDFARLPLSGVIVIGVGLPPPSLQRERQRQHFEHSSRNGQQVAFLQPAMTRILQAAGRLLRSPEQRGVVCLIDPRYDRAEYRRFFPEHWQPRTVPAASLGEVVANFWEETMLAADSAQCDSLEIAS